MLTTKQWIRRVVALLVLAGIGLPAYAQSSTGDDVTKVGTTAADFLTIPVGARAVAMGSAYSASAVDAAAVYWNPAGLADVAGGTFTVEHAEWLQEIAFNYAALVLPTGAGTFGLSVTALRTGDIEVTTEYEQNGTGETYSAGLYAFGLSYGRALTDRFRLGGNAKLVTERIANSTATGVALDVGTLFTTPFRGIRLGASISNFGTKMQMGGDDLLVPVDIAPGQAGNNESVRGEITTDPFDLPLTMRIGLAGELYQSEETRVTLAVDALNPNNNSQYLNLGMEAAFLGGLVSFRGGYNELFMEDSPYSFTLGGGLDYGFGAAHFTLDYAYQAHDYLNAVNRFTLGVRF